MNPIFKVYKPEGFSSVNSYLFTANPNALIDFLKKGFFAEEINRSIDDRTDEISNCIMQIGDSCFMISQARGDFQEMKTALYLFVNDVDSLHQNALEHGAVEIFSPDDMDYGDRQSGVMDPAGNYWWISKRLENKGYHE